MYKLITHYIMYVYIINVQADYPLYNVHVHIYYVHNVHNKCTCTYLSTVQVKKLTFRFHKIFLFRCESIILHRRLKFVATEKKVEMFIYFLLLLSTS